MSTYSILYFNINSLCGQVIFKKSRREFLKIVAITRVPQRLYKKLENLLEATIKICYNIRVISNKYHVRQQMQGDREYVRLF